MVDGEYQLYEARDAAFVRKELFWHPELEEIAKQFSDEEIIRLNRGGHDPKKKSMLPMLKPRKPKVSRR